MSRSNIGIVFASRVNVRKDGRAKDLYSHQRSKFNDPLPSVPIHQPTLTTHCFFCILMGAIPVIKW